MRFMDHDECVNRLINDYHAHGSLIVAYDFDNTVFDYHGDGLDCSNVIDLLRKAKDKGHILVCYTANEDLEFVKSFIKENNIPLDFINESPVKSGSKIYYNILLDDRSGLESAFNQLEDFLNKTKEV